MDNGARASARFNLRSGGTLQCPARFRFVRRSGVNAALRVPNRREKTQKNEPFAVLPLLTGICKFGKPL